MWWSCVFTKQLPKSDDFKIRHFCGSNFKTAKIWTLTKTLTKWKLYYVLLVECDNYETVLKMLRTLRYRSMNPAQVQDVENFEFIIDELSSFNERTKEIFNPDPDDVNI